jgi:uncharacterized membrane protein YeiB
MFAAHTIRVPGEQIYDGRSAILFATIAGVSLGLLTGAASPPPPGARGPARLVVLTRGAVLVLLGLAITMFLRPPIYVILDVYGFGFVLLLGVLFAARPVLAVVGGVLTVVGPLAVAGLSETTDPESLPAPIQVFAGWLVYGPYPLLVWLVFLLAGLVVARSDLRDRVTAAIALVGGLLAAVVGYVAGHLVPGVSAAAHSGTTAEILGSGGLAIAIVGAFSLLDSATGVGERVAKVIRFVLAPLAAAGAMALTLYTAHAVVLAIFRGTSEQPERWEVPSWAFPALVIGALVVATLWRRFLGIGPLERGLRALTRLVVRRPVRPRVAP